MDPHALASLRVASGVAAVLVAATCSDSTGPAALQDAAALQASLDAIDTIFAAPLVRSVGLFLYGVPIPPPATGAPLIPDSLLGKTFVWSCDSLRYVGSAVPGAPLRSVRFILYALAPAGSVLCPAAGLGQLDLTDASTADTTALHLTATAAAGGAAYADYTMRHAVTDPRYTASTLGSLSDGRQRLNFSIAGHPDLATHTGVDTIRLDDSAAHTHETLRDWHQMGVDTYSDSLDFTFRHDTTTLGLTGRVDWANTFTFWDETVTLDGLPFAKVTGQRVPQEGQPTVTALRPWLGAEQRRLLRDFISAPPRVLGALTRLLGPGVHLVNGP